MEGGRYGKEAGLVGAVAAGAMAMAVAVAVVAAVVLTAAVVVSMAVAEDQCQPLVSLLLGLGGDDDLCRHTKYFGNIWLLFGVLFSICVFVVIPIRDEYLAFYLCYKSKNQIHK